MDTLKKIIKKDFDEAKVLYWLAFGIFLLGLALLVWFGVGYIKHKQTGDSGTVLFDVLDIEEDENTICEHMRILDGVCVEKNNIDPRLIAVMIENHVDSRPQSGIAEARVVYEAPVEANITRFMAIFTKDAEVEKVGPVRSARPYYLDWLSEYESPLYVHVGGSPEALERIKNENKFDMDEFRYGQYFWRSRDRLAPHNAYTSSKLWKLRLENENRKGDVWEAWKFAKHENCEEECVSNIEVSYGIYGYDVTWKYSSSTGQYERYQRKRKHTLQDGNVLEVDTVIVQFVETKVIDNEGRLSMETLGEGPLKIFRKGHMVEGTWKKEKVGSRTKWFDEEDKEITLEPGKIWINVVNGRGEVTSE